MSAPEGQYCKRADGTCNVADEAGVCAVMPEICTDELEPVCACDRVTYSNACMAAAAGVNTESVGACP